MIQMDSNTYLELFPKFCEHFCGTVDAPPCLPPFINKGVTLAHSPRNTSISGRKHRIFFDWYQPTIFSSAEVVIQKFVEHSKLISELLQISDFSLNNFILTSVRQQQYIQGVDFVVDGTLIFHIQTGRILNSQRNASVSTLYDNLYLKYKSKKDLGPLQPKDENFIHDPESDTLETGECNVVCSGYYARYLSFILRDLFPNHQVSRVDVACDQSEEGLFDTAVDEINYIIGVDKNFKHLLLETAGDWVNGKNGRTLYVGKSTLDPDGKRSKKKSSKCFLRIYEKGLEQLTNSENVCTEIDPNWIRYELQVRPEGKKRKLACAKASPDDIWRYRAWSGRYYKKMIDATTVPVTDLRGRKRISDSDAAFLHMCKQYLPTLRKKARTESKEALLAELSLLIDEG